MQANEHARVDDIEHENAYLSKIMDMVSSLIVMDRASQRK